MANKANVLVCALLVFTMLAALPARAQICTITESTLTLCISGTCIIDTTFLTTLCGVLSSPQINVAVTSATTISFNSALSVAGINVSSSASVTVNLNAVVQIANDLVVSGTSTVKVLAGAVVTTGGKLQVAAAATIQVAGNLTVQGAVLIYGQLQLAGTIAENAAQNAWLIATTSSVQVQGSASASAWITGNGGIKGNLALSGNVTLAAGNSPGNVYVNGDLDMSDTTTLKLDVASDASFDRYYISGSFKRDGILYATFEGSYTPSEGQVFVFATHTNSEGKFSVSHGDFDGTFSKVHPHYNTLTTTFTYGNAANIAAPIILIALCIMSIVF